MRILFGLIMVALLAACGDESITGKISGSNGSPLPDVSVSVLGTDLTTKTDENGSFTIASKEGNVVLSYEKEGFVKSNIQLKSDSQKSDFISITLKRFTEERETLVDEVMHRFINLDYLGLMKASIANPEMKEAYLNATVDTWGESNAKEYIYVVEAMNQSVESDGFLDGIKFELNGTVQDLKCVNKIENDDIEQECIGYYQGLVDGKPATITAFVDMLKTSKGWLYTSSGINYEEN